jgi:uncharacterized protein YlxW (UPF0749 family)
MSVTKRFTGLVTGKHGSPWSAIEETDRALSARCDVLLNNIVELSERVSDLLEYVSQLDEKVKALSSALDKKRAKKGVSMATAMERDE